MIGRSATLGREEIARLIPHQNAMCLLDRLMAWSTTSVHCAAVSHSDAANPLRTATGLLAPAAIEYAGQAMALHGALLAPADAAVAAGYLASVRAVRLYVPRLDDVRGALQVRARRHAGEGDLASYEFDVRDDSGRLLVEGRATVVLNAAMP